jgi:hypothetical protein
LRPEQSQPFRQEQSQPYQQEQSQPFWQEYSQSISAEQGEQFYKEHGQVVRQDKDRQYCQEDSQQSFLEHHRANQSGDTCERCFPEYGGADYCRPMLGSSGMEGTLADSELCKHDVSSDKKDLSQVAGSETGQFDDQSDRAFDTSGAHGSFRKSASCSRQFCDHTDSFPVFNIDSPYQSDKALKTRSAHDSTHQNSADSCCDFRDDENESSFVVVGVTQDGPHIVGGQHNDDIPGLCTWQGTKRRQSPAVPWLTQ